MSGEGAGAGVEDVIMRATVARPGGSCPARTTQGGDGVVRADKADEHRLRVLGRRSQPAAKRRGGAGIDLKLLGRRGPDVEFLPVLVANREAEHRDVLRVARQIDDLADHLERFAPGLLDKSGAHVADIEAVGRGSQAQLLVDRRGFRREADGFVTEDRQ